MKNALRRVFNDFATTLQEIQKEVALSILTGSRSIALRDVSFQAIRS